MAKVRKDGKGRVLHKGEMYVRSKGLYSFSYTDAFGKRKYLYSKTLEDLRDKELELQRNRVDRLEAYVMAKADINYVFDRYIATKSELRSLVLSRGSSYHKNQRLRTRVGSANHFSRMFG